MFVHGFRNGYKTHGDGWKLLQADSRHGKVRLSGMGEIRLRGQGRFAGTPKTCEVLRKGGRWYLAVTFDVEFDQVARSSGAKAAAFDWGLDKLLTIADSDGTVEHIENPRWLKARLAALKTLQRAVSAEIERIKAAMGLAPDQPFPKGFRLTPTPKLKRLSRQLAALHRKVAAQRKDFYHKLTTRLAETYAMLGTEALEPAKMARRPKAKPDPDTPGEFLANGAARKAGLNRGILDAAPSMLIGMLRTKAEEAGSWFVEANTRKLKPTQRCHQCGTLVKKTLSDRTHICSCGCVCDRDENAAKTLLRWMTEGDFWLGTGQTGPCRTGLPSETPPIAALAV